MTSIHDAGGSVLRTVSLTAGGALVVRGHDLGPAVVRGLLLPATMAWLGKRAHTGPAWLPRLHH